MEEQAQPFNSETELHNLDTRLEGVRKKFKGWTDRIPQYNKEIENRSQQYVEKGARQCEAIAQDIKEYRALLSDNKKKLSLDAELEAKLKAELEDIAEQADTVLQQKEQKESQVTKYEQKNKELKDTLTEKEASTGENRQTVERATKMFRDTLGMQLKKLTGGRMQVVFIFIDPDKPNEQFAFTVKITENKYNITDVQPHVPELPELLSTLNATNDFSRFIKSIRAAFVRSVKT